MPRLSIGGNSSMRGKIFRLFILQYLGTVKADVFRAHFLGVGGWPRAPGRNLEASMIRDSFCKYMSRWLEAARLDKQEALVC
jgi:hypothetical protein